VVQAGHPGAAGPMGPGPRSRRKARSASLLQHRRTLEPADIIALYVRRWQIEVTFAETRAHLGVETQRQWSDQAIARTTPVLLGLYSLVSLWACDLLTSTSIPYAAAWYRKASLTFSDAIGAVRLQLWVGDINQHSPPNREPQNIPTHRVIRMAQDLCFAA
jgi:hypothetical protein